MTTKKSTSLAKRPKNTPATKPKGEMVAEVSSTKDQERERAKAKLFLSPCAAAAVAASGYMKTFGEPEADVPALMHTLKESMQRVHEGDLREAESMLIGQAHALQAIFMHLALRSSKLNALKEYEMEMRLALKAQAQCCRTIETLAAMKNPPMVLARQANVTTGPQQINNGTLAPAGAVPSCGESKPEPNELLESNHVEWMDARTKSKAS